MFVTIQKAVELTGRSRSTIGRYINSGKLSKTEKGIDVAELTRVFGQLDGRVDAPMHQPLGSKVTTRATSREEWLMRQVEALQQQLNEQKAEYLERERRLMALLEHQSTGVGDRQGLFGRLFK